MYVKPAEGLKIPDPDRFDWLPEEGRDVPATAYWHRRLRDKDVVKADSPAAEAVPPAVEADPPAKES